jgi:hypothetical protein
VRFVVGRCCVVVDVLQWHCVDVEGQRGWLEHKGKGEARLRAKYKSPDITFSLIT